MKQQYDFDVVIVGGGIVGLLTAYHLQSSHPHKRIALFTEHAIGHGNSNKCVALSSPICENEDVAAMYVASQEVLTKYAARENYQVHQKPIYSVRRRSEGLSGNYSEQFLLASEARLDFINRYADVVAVYPHDAVYYHGIGNFFNIDDVLQRLTKGFCNSGGVVKEHTRVANIERTASGVRVATPGGTFDAETTVLCLGPQLLLTEVVQNLNTTSRNKKVVAFKCNPSASRDDLPVFNFPDDRAFLLPRADGYYLSVTSNEWGAEVSWKENDLDQALLNAVSARRLAFKGPWQPIVGGDNYTHDRLPVAKEHAPGIIYVEGSSGRGLKLGGYIASEVERLIARSAH